MRIARILRETERDRMMQEADPAWNKRNKR